MTSVETSGSGTVGGGEQLVGEAKITANTDTVDGLALPVSIKKKTAVIKNLRSRYSFPLCEYVAAADTQ